MPKPQFLYFIIEQPVCRLDVTLSCLRRGQNVELDQESFNVDFEIRVVKTEMIEKFNIRVY